MRPRSQEAHAAVEAALTKAERGFRSSGDVGRLGQVLAVRSLITRERGEMALAAQYARAALELLPPHETTWHNICLVNLGIGESVQGHLSNAGEFYAQALALCQTPGSRAFARGNIGLLSWVQIEQGELQHAAAQLSQMLAEARAQGDLDDIGQALQALAEINYEYNDLDAAERQAAEAVQTGHMHPYEPYCVNAVLTLAHIEQARNQPAAALARCAALLAQSPLPLLPADQQMQRRIRAAQARFCLAAGDLAAAQRWQANRAPDQGEDQLPLEREHALAARVYLAAGDPGAAQQLLEPLLIAAEAGGHARVTLEARVLLALANAANGQDQQARQILAVALSSACAAGFIRSFVDEGEPLTALLRATLPTLSDRRVIAYARVLLRAATGAPSVPAPTETLSEQERRVLRLIVAGRSNPEIAAELVVSVNTIKSHVKAIYRKLDVRSRMEAAAAARKLNLT
jgi:LuxR family maltose regulon positive regulatory protein